MLDSWRFKKFRQPSSPFAACGFMDLVPALAVMLGAGVGITLIVQMLSFNVSAAVAHLIPDWSDRFPSWPTHLGPRRWTYNHRTRFNVARAPYSARHTSTSREYPECLYFSSGDNGRSTAVPVGCCHTNLGSPFKRGSCSVRHVAWPCAIYHSDRSTRAFSGKVEGRRGRYVADCGLASIDAEREQFAMDVRRALERTGRAHPADTSGNVAALTHARWLAARATKNRNRIAISSVDHGYTPRRCRLARRAARL
jgi:hypothetical protein